MSGFVRRIALALFAMACVVTPAYAASVPVVIQIAYQFTTPSGGEKLWIEQVQINRAELADKTCAAASKNGRKIAKYLVTNFRELVGHTYVSAACVMTNGKIKMSNRPFGPWRQIDPVGVALYYKDANGGTHPSLFYDLRTPMSMAQCTQQLRSLTSRFKKNISDNIRDFDGMKFVKSECAFVEGFKL